MLLYLCLHACVYSIQFNSKIMSKVHYGRALYSFRKTKTWLQVFNKRDGAPCTLAFVTRPLGCLCRREIRCRNASMSKRLSRPPNAPRHHSAMVLHRILTLWSIV